jgi:hypothetical protein
MARQRVRQRVQLSKKFRPFEASPLRIAGANDALQFAAVKSRAL